MAFNIRITFFAIFTIALLASVACETSEQKNATATAQSGGVDREFLSAEATSEAEHGGYDDRLLSIDETATAEAIALEDVEANANETPSSGRQLTSRRSSTSGLTTTSSSSTAAGTSTTGGSSTTATATPPTAPTPTPAPAPTATEVPTATPAPANNGPWLTAQEAIEIASAAQPGRVESISGHVSHETGQKNAGDTANTAPSPGGGYSTSWGVTIVNGDEIYHCPVLNRTAECSTLFSASDGSVEEVTSDSTDVINIWKGNSEWNELLQNDNISILIFLSQKAGPGTPISWQALVSVHGETTGLRGGNFYWTPATGETVFNTYK